MPLAVMPGNVAVRVTRQADSGVDAPPGSFASERRDVGRGEGGSVGSVIHQVRLNPLQTGNLQAKFDHIVFH